jgi:two-component system, CitB family, sensor kinase
VELASSQCTKSGQCAEDGQCIADGQCAEDGQRMADGQRTETEQCTQGTADGTGVVLRVTDSGPGIPREHRELVFAEGWSTKDPPPHGQRGLGLALVRRLAERHGGTARVGESAGGGAEFTVVLPEAMHPQAADADQQDAAADTTVAPDAPAPRSSGGPGTRQ